ncbi:uncharacterized protein F54H12.2-like [Pecten maximus]|uniref:uncharacterized protein F54H12.2-like n=1 Tax=Pecten maximus TaxID=6579 RepID=UPI00145813FF|nr:uncharacterized protein F54H12.2-like [Pecten maximus]
MSFLSDNVNHIGLPAALSIFTVPPNQVAIEKVYFSECRPMSSFNISDAPIEIYVPGSGDRYIDLHKSRLYVKCRVKKADDSVLAENEKTGIINLLLQSMWSQIDIYMNGKLVSLNTNNYPWKAYLKTILSSGTDATKSQLTSQMFYLDDYDMDDAKPIVSGTNAGLKKRYSYTKESKVFDMEGPLYEDIFGIDKYLLNGVDLQLKLFRNKAPFFLMSDETDPSYKLEILDVAFKACMIKVDSGVLVNHAKLLKDTTAKYPLVRTEVKMNTVGSGAGSFIWQNVWANNMPTKAVFAFVKQAAVNGDYTKNPFNFVNLAQEVTLYVNGESMPARPMKMDIGDNRNNVTPFCSLFDVAGKWNQNEGLMINRDTFTMGHAIVRLRSRTLRPWRGVYKPGASRQHQIGS